MGGGGSDGMRAENGRDVEVQRDAGGDAVYGAEDNDAAIRGGSGNDFVYGGTGTDNLYDGYDLDNLDGGTGSNTWYQCADGISNETYVNITSFVGPSSAYC